MRVFLCVALSCGPEHVYQGVCVLCVIVFGGVYLLTSKHLHDFGLAWNIEPTTTKLAVVHSSFARIWLSTCFCIKKQQMK